MHQRLLRKGAEHHSTQARTTATRARATTSPELCRNPSANSDTTRPIRKDVLQQQLQLPWRDADRIEQVCKLCDDPPGSTLGCE
eukprot:5294115-Pyramimonas_sp.AAC.1